MSDREPVTPPSGQRVALVTGATGMVGPRVVERFAASGFKVRVLATRPRPGLFAPDVEVRIGDITDPGSARSSVEGVDTVVHMAALLHATEGTAPDFDAYRRTNVEGTRQMVNASVDANVRRFVFFSTIAVYGHGHGELWTESSPLNPDTPYGVTKAEAERLVLAAMRRDRTPLGVVLRLAAVIGPNLKGNYLRLVQALAARRFLPLGPGWNRRALITHRDVAEAALVVARHPAAAGRIYNLSDGTGYPLAEIIDAICHALGRRPPRFRLPLTPIRAVVRSVEALAHLLHVRSPVSSTMVEKYTEDIRVDDRRLCEELNFAAGHRLDDAWIEAIADMRRAGQI